MALIVLSWVRGPHERTRAVQCICVLVFWRPSYHAVNEQLLSILLVPADDQLTPPPLGPPAARLMDAWMHGLVYEGMASSPSMGVVQGRGLDAQSSREGMSSGGEDEEEEEELPWSAREVELLDGLVRNFGACVRASQGFCWFGSIRGVFAS